MTPSPSGTNIDSIAAYLMDEEDDEKHLQALPCHGVLLTEYDPKLLTPIKARADWDEACPKAKIGVVMKKSRKYESEVLVDNEKIDTTHGSYINKTPTGTIPKYKTKSHFLLGIATVPLENREMRGGSKRLWVKKASCENTEIWEGHGVIVVRG
eukprot:15365407-Ditylum_brightwellii.AAC.1